MATACFSAEILLDKQKVICDLNQTPVPAMLKTGETPFNSDSLFQFEDHHAPTKCFHSEHVTAMLFILRSRQCRSEHDHFGRSSHVDPLTSGFIDSG